MFQTRQSLLCHSSLCFYWYEELRIHSKQTSQHRRHLCWVDSYSPHNLRSHHRCRSDWDIDEIRSWKRLNGYLSFSWQGLEQESDRDSQQVSWEWFLVFPQQLPFIYWTFAWTWIDYGHSIQEEDQSEVPIIPVSITSPAVPNLFTAKISQNCTRTSAWHQGKYVSSVC